MGVSFQDNKHFFFFILGDNHLLHRDPIKEKDALEHQIKTYEQFFVYHDNVGYCVSVQM